MRRASAGVILAGAMAAGPAGAQDVRLLGYNASLTAVCNVGCTSLTISLLLGGVQPTDNKGAPVPGAIAALNGLLRNATFQVFGANPTILGVTGAGSASATIDNGPANYAAVVLNNLLTPLTSNGASIVLSLAAGANVSQVTASGLAYANAELNYLNASGAVASTPQSGGTYYQTGDFSATVAGGSLGLSAVPEPSSYALLATGLVGLLGMARARRRLVG